MNKNIRLKLAFKDLVDETCDGTLEKTEKEGIPAKYPGELLERHREYGFSTEDDVLSLAFALAKYEPDEWNEQDRKKCFVTDQRKLFIKEVEGLTPSFLRSIALYLCEKDKKYLAEANDLLKGTSFTDALDGIGELIEYGIKPWMDKIHWEQMLEQCIDSSKIRPIHDLLPVTWENLGRYYVLYNIAALSVFKYTDKGWGKFMKDFRLLFSGAYTERHFERLESLGFTTEEVYDLLITLAIYDPRLLDKGYEVFMDQFMSADDDVRWFIGYLDLSKDEHQAYKEEIRKFCEKGYHYLVRKFYDGSGSEQRHNIMLLAKAEIFGQLEDVKYADLSREIGCDIPEDTEKKWKRNITMCHHKGYQIYEYDDFYHLMTMGRIPVRTCMDYEDGVYKECLLSIFDGNKKLLNVEKDGKCIARAIVRFTKYSKNTVITDKLSFNDVSSMQKSKDEGKEELVIFLERSYKANVSDKEETAVENAMISFIKEKAMHMGVKFIISSDYGWALHENADSYKKVSGNMYISESKNAMQYLDSLGGKKSKGGYYCKLYDQAYVLSDTEFSIA